MYHGTCPSSNLPRQSLSASFDLDVPHVVSARRSRLAALPCCAEPSGSAESRAERHGGRQDSDGPRSCLALQTSSSENGHLDFAARRPVALPAALKRTGFVRSRITPADSVLRSATPAIPAPATPRPQRSIRVWLNDSSGSVQPFSHMSAGNCMVHPARPERRRGNHEKRNAHQCHPARGKPHCHR